MAEVRHARDSRGGRKSEVITIRLDPRLKYLAELAARRQRRPLSSYVEWAIEASLSQVRPSYDNGPEEHQETFADVASALWDVDEADRFSKLALKYPELLTHEEQVIWKLIRECGYVWKGKYAGDGGEWTWTVRHESLIAERLRESWQTFVKIAQGELLPNALPKWQKLKSEPPKSRSPSDDLDDEIPF
jgi:hypothetical protein